MEKRDILSLNHKEIETIVLQYLKDKGYTDIEFMQVKYEGGKLNCNVSVNRQTIDLQLEPVTDESLPPIVKRKRGRPTREEVAADEGGENRV